MADKYIPQEIEPKWQARWERDALYESGPLDSKPKYYILDFYPYPSGEGMSVGHARNYVPTDVLARYYRMKGYNVLHPMGFDAFGLPTENAAIKLKTNPHLLNERYSANYVRQYKLMGLSYDWSRLLNSAHDDYYRWTQWIFVQIFKSWYDPRQGKAAPIAGLELELSQQGAQAIFDYVDTHPQHIGVLTKGTPMITAQQWNAYSRREKNAYLMNFRLAFRAESVVNWDPVDKVVVADEEVENGRAWRSGALVEKKVIRQWFFRITAYADRLADDLDTVDWPEKIVKMQRNWIGKSEGAEVDFQIADSTQGQSSIRVFTTRPDTLWGATFMVLSPEHALVSQITTPQQREAVDAYIAYAHGETDEQRTAEQKEKTGVFTGAYAINPVNGRRIPIWIADYVLSGYGTGAIMAVPAHDERDFAFALKFGLPIIPVIDRLDHVAKSLVFPGSVREGFQADLQKTGIEFTAGPVGSVGEGLFVTLRGEQQIDQYIALTRKYLEPNNWNEIVGARWCFIFDDGVQALDSADSDSRILARCKAIYPPVQDNRTCMEMLSHLPFYQDVLFHAEYGPLINSESFTGTPGDVARHKVTAWLAERGVGKARVNYKIRSWLISRQRYWGTPIPIIHTADGEMAVDESELPVRLPDVQNYEPTATGESPLANIPQFVDTPQGRRETDTMATWACSSWYYMRFADAHNDQAPFGQKEIAYWLPVDMYVGGAEHAVLHLLYARMWTKVLYDLGYVPFIEPFKALRNQGLILSPQKKVDEKGREYYEKMSKSKGNVITPDEVIAEHGADALRGYEMFISDFAQTVPWSTLGVPGVRRWLERVWRIVLAPDEDKGQPAQFTARELRRVTHQTIQKYERDLLNFGFNTVVAALMEFTNALYHARDAGLSGTPEWAESIDILLRLAAPIAPHMAEELWSRMGHAYSIHQQPFPVADAAAAKEDEITIVVQVNGKVRDRIVVPAGTAEEKVREAALASEGAQRFMNGAQPKQVRYVAGRLVNIVV
ncbi:MAG TPA: leucine--tRNA ligase [Anaerolineae bacterium]